MTFGHPFTPHHNHYEPCRVFRWKTIRSTDSNNYTGHEDQANGARQLAPVQRIPIEEHGLHARECTPAHDLPGSTVLKLNDLSQGLEEMSDRA